jgi:hypothetical protein
MAQKQTFDDEIETRTVSSVAAVIAEAIRRAREQPESTELREFAREGLRLLEAWIARQRHHLGDA